MSTSNPKTRPQSPAAWWAVSSVRARMTAVGAAALVLALVAVSAFVWISPASPVRQAIDSASTEQVMQEEFDKQRKELLSEIRELKRVLKLSSANLAVTKEQKAELQQALWSAEGTLAAIEANRGSGSRAARPSTPQQSNGSNQAAAETVITAPSKGELVNPASSYYGMYTQQAPFNWATFDATSARTGSTPNVVGYFGGWNEGFRANAVTRAWERDFLPILTWESRPITSGNDQVDEPDYTLPAIIGDPAAGVPGAYDDYLRQYARDIVATGLPLGIRLNHEMNGVWYPWSETDGQGQSINGNRVGDYVKMWQHVHDIFAEEGANDLVIWIWSPNIINNLPSRNKSSEFLDGLYPGDAYVDWVGLSGYLRPAYKPENNFTFDYTFTRSLDELRRITRKPIFLAEVGASETGGHKAKWVSSFFEGLAEPKNNDIIGFAWFNLAVTTYVEGERATNDWRVDSRADSLAAFIAGLNLPHGAFASLKQ